MTTFRTWRPANSRMTAVAVEISTRPGKVCRRRAVVKRGARSALMMIADAQVHTWTAGSPPVVHRQAPFTNDELLRAMDEAGVDRAVLVPPGWDPEAIIHS